MAGYNGWRLGYGEVVFQGAPLQPGFEEGERIRSGKQREINVE